MRTCEKLKKLTVIAGLMVCYCLIMYVSGIGCPFRFLFGISCPGCGMTRALFSCLRLDFIMAFTYHPMWLFVVVGALLLIVLYLLDKKLSFNITVYALGLLLIAVYIVRMHIGSDVVYIDFNNGLIGKLFSLLFL